MPAVSILGGPRSVVRRKHPIGVLEVSRPARRFTGRWSERASVFANKRGNAIMRPSRWPVSGGIKTARSSSAIRSAP